MESRYMLEQPSRVAGKDFIWRPENSVPMAAAAFTNGPVFFSSRVMDGGGGGGGGSVEGKSERSSPPGNGLPPGGRLRPHDVEKTGLGDLKESGSSGVLKESGPSGVLKRSSPTHCPAGGQLQGVFMQLDIRNELGPAFRPATGRIATATERQPLASSHIPVPRNRKPSGHADKEVMAATVLTSLSTSPLVLHPSCAPTVPEAAGRAWKEVLSASYSSSTSGCWSWDASDQSVPSTPSPPLSNDNKNNFLSAHGDDAVEDNAESTHFMFEDPIPRKRKNSMKVMFKCLWKNCEKVLSTSSGIQRHVRTVPHSEHINVSHSQSHAPSLLSQSAPSTLCHIRTDHAYQGPVTHVRTVCIGEKRQPAPGPHTVANGNGLKGHSTTPAPKPAAGTRKPRGEAKKCRKVYGMEKRDMWCTACRWKKACQRFTD